ncbi:L,D-transpeptidase [Actinacidiphila rubida]|uniref:L,D-transpeptidase n=1 Tax=Actinacidiphila rubida TaxID=310780 RepID=A0A1H8ME72_9ACTN|nr:L,D-transpeptidase [Actinacidiphila rubida]SEO15584.1 hypothetical protein SAMN05216267_1018165 [Actinacidiphila rubida]
MSRGIPSWVTVSGLTAGAMVVVSVLAFQASGSPPADPTAAPTPHPTVSKPHAVPTTPPPVPTGGDTGKRVVYSLSQNRVWVVTKTGAVSTFQVQAGTVPATPGVYYVSKREASAVGTDGKQVEHLVFFEYTAESWVAFSAPVDDKVTAPDPGLRTGAIRVHRADALKIWNNTVKGSTVVVFK